MQKATAHQIILSLGSNLGDRSSNLAHAIALLKEVFHSEFKISSIYETEPVGFQSEHTFLNMVATFTSRLNSEQILAEVMAIEKKMGRIRKGEKIMDRPIDIDILFIGDEVIQSAQLVVPHRRLHERNFVLTPLLDIVPEFIHPVLNKPIWQLYDECRDISEISEF